MQLDSQQTVTLSGSAARGIGPQIRELAALPLTVRLGRIRPAALPSVPRFRAFFDPGKMATPPPQSINRRDAAGPALARMYLNDRFGCHSADTEVLTEHGWRRWLDYDGRSLLGTMNQRTGLLEFQAPLACQRYDHDGPMAFAAHKGLDFALTPDHRMFYRRYEIPFPYTPGGAAYGEPRFGAVESLPTRCLIPGSTTGFVGTELQRLRVGERTWDGTDFLRLLALVISDGWVSGSESNPNVLSFCCFRDDRREMVAALAYRLGIREQRHRPGTWVLSDGALANWLRANAYVGDEYRSHRKRVPDLVKVASQGQIEEFLTFFGDQHQGEKCGRQFYSSSRRLVDDLQELLLRVGKRGTIHDNPQRPGHAASDGRWFESRHPSFTLHEHLEGDVTLQRLKRCPTIEYDHYKGEVFCATVPNSTLVTRRNGRVLISGNCCVVSGKAHYFGLVAGAEAHADLEASDAEIQSQYVRVCGPGDRGCQITTVLDYCRTQGFLLGGKRYKLDGYVACDWTQQVEVQVVQVLFGASCIGINLPQAWTTTNVWDLTNTPIVGGHDVTPIDYDERGVYVSSWGRVFLVTWAAFTSKRWVEEYYALLAPLWYGADGLAPSGVDVAGLKAALDALAHGELPPLPGPPAPPTPPPPSGSWHFTLAVDKGTGAPSVTQVLP